MGEFVTRTYRDLHKGHDLTYFKVQVKQTDLAIGVDRDCFSPFLAERTERLVIKLRGDLETYALLHPPFLSSLEPISLLPNAPEIARRMAEAAMQAGVGPMAAVAGAFAEEVGLFLGTQSKNVIVENGGDLFVKTITERKVAVFAGDSPFSNRIAIRIKPEESTLGICTSSGTVGPSLSFGRADAALVKARTAYLADAVASGVGNRVTDKDDLLTAIEYGQQVAGVKGMLIIMEDKMAAWGDIEIIRI
ncbi:MAG: UPF0280 family protein [Ignavibacteriales bacterium]